MTRIFHRFHESGGFTLVEVIVALAIVSAAFAALAVR
jgi:prepilin-type N-terminal cleavage/methylation domain-containing protein